MSRVRLLIAIALVVFVLLGALGLLALAALDDTDAPPIRAHARELALTAERLRLLRPEIAALTARQAERSQPHVRLQANCYEDSGGAGQPWLGGTWRVRRQAASKAANEIADALLSSGWQGAPSPNRFGTYELRRPYPGWNALAYIGDFAGVDDARVVDVYIDVRVADASPCYVESQQ